MKPPKAGIFAAAGQVQDRSSAIKRKQCCIKDPGSKRLVSEPSDAPTKSGFEHDLGALKKGSINPANNDRCSNGNYEKGIARPANREDKTK